MSTSITPTTDTMCARLRTMDRGRFDRELTAATRELVREMTHAADNGAAKPKGKLTITVDFVLDRGMMDVCADFATKLPKKARGRTVMYPGPTGELLAEDPKQLSLDISAREPMTVPDSGRPMRAV